MSDDIKNDVDVNDKPSNANAEAAKYRKRASELKAKVAELESKLVDLEAEKDAALRAVENAPGEAAAKIAELEGRIRTRMHKDAFARLSAGKIRPDALDDAFALSGWKIETDDVDESNMGEAIGSLIESKPYLKVEETTSPVEDSTTPAPAVRSYSLTGYKPKPVAGAGRGPAPEATPKNTKSAYRL